MSFLLGGDVGLKNNNRFMILIMLSLIIGLLGACGSSNEEVSGEPSKLEEEVFPALNDVPLGLNKISFEELIEKLDNKESFWLVTIDYLDEDMKEIGELVNLESNFDEELKNNDMGAYYVDFYEYKEKHGDYLISNDEMNERYRHKAYEGYLSHYANKENRENANMFFVTNYGIDNFTDGKDMIMFSKNKEGVEDWLGEGAFDSGLYEDYIIDDIAEKVRKNLSVYKELVPL